MRRLIIWISVIFFIMATSLYIYRFFSVGSEEGNLTDKLLQQKSLKITTANKLTYDMVKDIVKDRHSVQTLTETEAEQMTYRFSEETANSVIKDDLFIYSGASYEPWVSKFIEKIEKTKVGIINASRGIWVLNLNKAREYTDIQGEKQELSENPYYWLNIKDYKTALSNIKNAIQELDPRQRNIYETNFNEAIKNLDVYVEKYDLLQEKMKNYTFVVASDNLDYFLNYLKLDYIKLEPEDLTPGNENSISAKIGETKNLVLIYDNAQTVAQYEDKINKYSMKRLNILIYDPAMTIYDIYDHNYNEMDTLPKIE